MADRVGQHVGNYRLVALLGQGGFAQVYLGQHVRLDLQAAIKVLHSHLTSSEAEHFQHEAQTIARLVHPAIVRIFDFDVQDGLPFLVMDYAPGGSLRQRYPKGSVVPLPLILSFVKQVASALQYAHDQHLIHRDVKPENMLVGRHEEVLLSDFGLVTLLPPSLSPQATEPMAQSLVGTTPYLAPEQVRGKARPASDQYALAVVVYEWLCGKPPFQGPFLEVAVQHVSVPPPSLCEQVPDLSPDIEKVVLRALAKEPEQRFARVEDFALALEEACRPEASSRPALSDLSSHRSSAARQASKHQLPAQPTPFIGREQEVARACELLSRPEVRLLTLTGPGGIGKTRLSLQVAAKLSDRFLDGVYFVSLAPLSDPELVVPTIAQALDVKERATRPMLEQLQAFLQEKQMLLVLDNFEQVVAAAPGLSDLLAACPHLKLLVTSRQVLRLSAEHEFAVPPLALPDLKHLPDLLTLSQYEAIALFIARAQAVKPEFQVSKATAPAVAEICARLDGLPLAIELAAARSKLLPPQALLVRLGQRLAVLTGGVRDAPARQHTLRNTITWSYDLLTSSEQQLFQRLSVFVGGSTLEAIEALYTALGDEPGQILDGVASLIDKSLLRQNEQEDGQPWFMMLETIREYGLEVLVASGEVEATQQAHAMYYLKFAEEAAPKLAGAEQQEWFARLERDHENLRAALDWLLKGGEAELALRLCSALSWFWLVQSHLSEGRTSLEKALAVSGEVDKALRAAALDGLGALLLNLGDNKQAERHLEESLALYRELGDTVSISWPIHTLGLVLMNQGEYTRARALLEESLARFSELGDKAGRAWSLCNLVWLYKVQGEYVTARSCAEESLALFRELEDNTGITAVLLYLANVLFVSQGDTATVAAMLEECRTLAREAGLDLIIPGALHLAAQVALGQGDVARARPLIEQSLAIDRAKGYRGFDGHTAEALVVLGQVAALEGDITAARSCYEEGLALARETHDKLRTALSLEGLAALRATQGEFCWAVHLWGAAAALRETMGSPLPPVERAAYERAISTARTQLGEKDFATAWAQGRSMTPEQALTAKEPVTMSTPVPAEQAFSPPPEKVTATYPDGLTAREVEVLRLVAQGLSNAEIAEQLFISLLTVKAHMRSLYNKLGIGSRSAATRYAIEHHLM